MKLLSQTFYGCFYRNNQKQYIWQYESFTNKNQAKEYSKKNNNDNSSVIIYINNIIPKCLHKCIIEHKIKDVIKIYNKKN
jgi:hypothetical protein